MQIFRPAAGEVAVDADVCDRYSTLCVPYPRPLYRLLSSVEMIARPHCLRYGHFG